MTTSTLLPAIRARVGDWNYYVTTLTFDNVRALIKAPDEIHERRQLADWIQREAIDAHADAISAYILNTSQRFLGALIIGVYGGRPDWTPISVKAPTEEGISEETMADLEGRLGLLRLSGEERLFAIDGQHRVAGIKSALSTCPDDEVLRGDSVSAIFVAHDATSDAGKARTRRLFTTVNKRAKVIAKSQTIALDEDNGFAIVTRMLIDQHPLFEDSRGHLLYSSTGSIPAGNALALTSVVGLSELVKDLYFGRASFDQGRPTDDAIQSHLSLCVAFLDALVDRVPEFKQVFVEKARRPGDFRLPENNHLLFRPAGQRTFARATQLLLSRGIELGAAIELLASVDLYLNNSPWHHILWNPVTQTMLTGTVVMAEAQLLTLAGQPVRNPSSVKKLHKLLAAVPAAIASSS